MTGESKRCALPDCMNILERASYPNSRAFRLARFCCASHGQQSRYQNGWTAIIQFEVTDGEELTYDQIAAIGNVSHQACQQVAEGALRKLANDPQMQMLAIAVVEMQGTEWRCGR